MQKQALILAVIAVLVGLVALTPIVFSAPGAAQTSFDIQYDEASAGADGPSPFTEDFKIKTTDETRFAFGPDAARSIRIRRANAEGNVTLRPRSNETTYDVEAIELNAGDIIEAREAAQDGVDRSPEIELTAFDSTGDRISPDMNVSVAGDLALFRDNAVDPYVLEVIGADGSVVASTDAEPHAVRYTASIEYNGSALAVTRAPSVDEEWYVELEQDIDGDERDETVLEFDHGDGDAFFTAETAGTEFNASQEFNVDIYANESDELGERIGGLFLLRISDENRVSGPVGDDGPNDTGGSDEADSLEASVSPASIPAGETTDVTVSVSTEAGAPVEDATVEIPALTSPATTGADGNVTFTLSPSFPEELPVSISAADYADTTETLTVETADPDDGGTATPGNDSAAGPVQLQVTEAPQTVQPNTTFTIMYDVVNGLELPTAYTLESTTASSNVTVTEFTGDIQSSDPAALPPSASTESVDGGGTAAVTVEYQVAANTTGDVQINITARDPLSGNRTNVSRNVTIQRTTAAPSDPTERALQITGKDAPTELTQNDVTATITRFEREQSVQNIEIGQDDVTTLITLFERN
jgi:hypothetical protein